MAKRRTAAARSDKGVLARQEVSRGGGKATAAPARKASAGGDESFVRDILAVCTFLGSIGLLCALWTYHRDDALAGRSTNLLGPLGFRFAGKLFGTFGICAYLGPAALFYTSLALFARGRGKHRWRQIFGLIALSFSGAVLGHLLVGQTSSLAYPPGGAIGAALGESLRAVLSTFGATLVMLAVAAGALIIATDAAFTRLCVAVGRLVGHGLAAGWAWGVAEGHRQLEAFKARREQRKLEIEEEEAAFAQSLADAESADHELGEDGALDDEAFEEEEEEVLATDGAPQAEDAKVAQQRKSLRPKVRQAELDASDADAIAEEAARLAREADERRVAEESEARARAAALKAAKRARRNQEDPAWVIAPPTPAQPAAPASVAAAPVEPPAPVAELKPPEPVPAPVQAAEKARPKLAIPSTPPVVAAPEVKPAEAAPVVAAPVVVPPVAAAPEPVGGPINAVPKLPVIVEPKAPPKPSKPTKQDPFAFEGESNFSLPPITLLEMDEKQKRVLDKEIFFATAEKLREKLASFGIDGQVKEIRPGPVVTMYEFEPAPGIKISKIASLSDDLAMAMEALRVRIVAPIPGKGVVGIEVPNKEREGVYLKEIVEQDAFMKSPSRLTMAIGKNIEGMPYVTDLAKMPHVLIAGTTGSGKSVSVNAMIMSLLLKSTPEEVRLIMVDPKVTELSIYEGIPHLLLPVVTDPHKAALALRWGVEEMERRYQLLADAGVRNIAGYNKWVDGKLKEEEGRAAEKTLEVKPEPAADAAPRKLRIIDVNEGETEEDALARAAASGMPGVAAPDLNDEPAPEVKLTADDRLEDRMAEVEAKKFESENAKELALAEDKKQPKKLPYIVIIIDEVADLMMVASREVETYVARLAQMARAAGIHLMIATQRPSTDVITGVIKANFPSRISFQLRSKPDSMTILGTVGAEALLGMGDMLILPPTSSHLERVHGAYVSDQEIQRVVAHLKAQGKPVYDESILKPRDEEGSGDEDGGGEEEFADEAYDQCLAIVSEMRQVSVSMLQRKLRLGYNRAARIIERMEREGIVGPANGSKPRDVLIRAVGETHKEVNL